jgi:hypothetical protein
MAMVWERREEREREQPQRVTHRKTEGLNGEWVLGAHGGGEMVRMGQEWQGSSARRRSLESAMKETQARTKVVLRHLPPSLSSSALHDQIVSKYAGTITWFAFHPGKSR